MGDSSPSSVRPDRFRRQIEHLLRHFEVVSLKRIVEASQQPGNRENLVSITFDDAYADLLEHALPLLRDHSLPATLFVAADTLGGTISTAEGPRPVMPLSRVRSLAREGFRVGSHGLSHRPLTGLAPDEARREIEESRHRLRDLVDQPVRSFAYPFGRCSGELARVVRSAGYARGVTCEERSVQRARDPYRLPRISISNQLNLAGFRVKLSWRLRLLRRLSAGWESVRSPGGT